MMETGKENVTASINGALVDELKSTLKIEKSEGNMVDYKSSGTF